jgi:hypothetical protein
MATVNKPGRQHAGASKNRNEGEGSRSAAKAYNEATRRYVDAGKGPDAAKEAARALDTSEHNELIDAEAKGKARARH